MASPSREDYMEAIWILTREHGVTRVSDIAQRLGLSLASASKMVQRLDHDGMVRYERYRGVTLTPAGEGRGQSLAARHAVLERLLVSLGLTDPTRIHDTVEGIEHYMEGEALQAVEALVELTHHDPAWWRRYQEYLAERKSAGHAVAPEA